MTLLKQILKSCHPLLARFASWYLARPRTGSYSGITIKVLPGVFHPGLFFSTQVLLKYLKNQPLRGKRILELGAGSGLISIYCSNKGAQVTSSDISKTALKCISENAKINHVDLNIVESDLFTNLNIVEFDLVVINPPYYPKRVSTEKDMPWFCGEAFEYFENLFFQLQTAPPSCEVIMILSEDCDLRRIEMIAGKNSLRLSIIDSSIRWGELSFIFRINE